MRPQTVQQNWSYFSNGPLGEEVFVPKRKKIQKEVQENLALPHL